MTIFNSALSHCCRKTTGNPIDLARLVWNQHGVRTSILAEPIAPVLSRLFSEIGSQETSMFIRLL